MTQIQAYENMSKEALIEHHLHTLQQHADDMDMLSKELVGKGIRPYSLNLDPLGIRSLTSDAITGAFDLGRQNSNPPPEGHWLAPFWLMGNAITPAAPTVPAETLRVCSVIANKIEEGALSHVGFYSNTALSEFIRQLMRAVAAMSPIAPVAPQIPRAPYSVEARVFSLATDAEASIYVASVPLSACTCPSGDGSLRWPCPVHPPETDNLTKSSNQQV